MVVSGQLSRLGEREEKGRVIKALVLFVLSLRLPSVLESCFGSAFSNGFWGWFGFFRVILQWYGLVFFRFGYLDVMYAMRTWEWDLIDVNCSDWWDDRTRVADSILSVQCTKYEVVCLNEQDMDSSSLLLISIPSRCIWYCVLMFYHSFQ